jgi:hypothetical protein
VYSFEYLESLITSNRCDKENKRRIGIAISAFSSMSNVLTSKKISMEVKLRVLKCYVWSTMMNASEAWTISIAMKLKLEAAEIKSSMRECYSVLVTAEVITRHGNFWDML